MRPITGRWNHCVHNEALFISPASLHFPSSSVRPRFFFFFSSPTALKIINVVEIRPSGIRQRLYREVTRRLEQLRLSVSAHLTPPTWPTCQFWFTLFQGLFSSSYWGENVLLDVLFIYLVSLPENSTNYLNLQEVVLMHVHLQYMYNIALLSCKMLLSVWPIGNSTVDYNIDS